MIKDTLRVIGIMAALIAAGAILLAGVSIASIFTIKLLELVGIPERWSQWLIPAILLACTAVWLNQSLKEMRRIKKEIKEIEAETDRLRKEMLQ